MEASDKEYICSLEKDNGMHRCADLPPTKYEHVECTSTVEDFLNYSKEPTELASALVGLPPVLRTGGGRTPFRIDKRQSTLAAAYGEPSSFASASASLVAAYSSSTSATYSPSVVNESMSSTDNFNAIFSLRDNQTLNCINWNRYYTKCKAGDKNPFQGTQRS